MRSEIVERAALVVLVKFFDDLRKCLKREWALPQRIIFDCVAGCAATNVTRSNLPCLPVLRNQLRLLPEIFNLGLNKFLVHTTSTHIEKKVSEGLSLHTGVVGLDQQKLWRPFTVESSSKRHVDFVSTHQRTTGIIRIDGHLRRSTRR